MTIALEYRMRIESWTGVSIFGNLLSRNSSLSCMNVYLAIDNDDYFRRALIVAWQEACLRRRGGVVLA